MIHIKRFYSWVPMENALDPGRKLNKGIDMFGNDLTVYETVKLSAYRIILHRM